MRSSGIPGLFRGNVPCLFREFHGFGLWFVTYEALLKYDMAAKSRNRKDVPLLNIALYGGIAGEVLWFATYPFDVIKSRMQTDGFGQEQRFKTMRAAISDTWRQYGTRGFFRGLGPTLARTMFTSGATFVTYVMLILFRALCLLTCTTVQSRSNTFWVDGRSIYSGYGSMDINFVTES